MKTYRIAALLLALVMAGSTLLSCGGNEPDETDAGKDTAYDESQAEYRTLVHDTALLGGISVASQNLDMMGAVLEVLGVESYRTVTPAWYETVLKVKYTRDDISAQIIDLINETATTNFIYAYNFAINGLGNVYRDLVTAGSSDYVSTVEKKLSAGETKLNAIIEAFRSKQD